MRTPLSAPCRFAALFAAAVVPLAAGADELARFGADPRWLRLGHYDDGESRVDSPTFFFAEGGQDDPIAELRATAVAIRTGEPSIGPLKQEPACAFPARARFIRENLPGQWPSQPTCKDFDAWRSGLDARGVTLVFASAYPGSPASMFGHTFLRLDGPDPLTSYVVSYAAQIPEFNALTYIPNGLFGGFAGYYDVGPYYMKLKEYGFLENRDLWEYPLALSQDEVDRLVEHIWELFVGNWQDYFFLDENCSYQMLALLETVRPEWQLLDDLPMIAAPKATVRTAFENIPQRGEPLVRAAERRELLRALEELDGRQRAQVHALRDGSLAPTETKDVAVVDAALTWLRYEKYADKGTLPADKATQLDKLLAARAKLGRSAPRTTGRSSIVPRNRADVGHRLTAVSLGVAGQADRRYATFAFRSGYHALTDPSAGYEPQFGLEFFGGSVAVRTDDDAHAVAPRLNIVSVTSLDPLGAIDRLPSWRARAGFNMTAPALCEACRALDGSASIGFALGDPFRFIAAAFVDMTASHDRGHGKLSPSLSALALADLEGWLKLQAELTRHDDRAVVRGGLFFNAWEGWKPGLEGERRLDGETAWSLSLERYL